MIKFKREESDCEKKRERSNVFVEKDGSWRVRENVKR